MISAAITLALAAPAAVPSVAPAPRVLAVQFAGDAFEPERLRRMMTLTPGAPLDPKALRTTLELYYQTGRYSAIRVDEQPAPGGVQLVFTFTRQIVVTDWHFSGNAHVKSADLVRALDLSYGQPLLPQHFERYGRIIEANYRRAGFPDAKVTINWKATQPGRAALSFDVLEGTPLTLRNLKILSLGGMSQQDVAHALGIRPGDRLSAENVSNGFDGLDALLTARGALNAEVDHYFVLPNGSRTTSVLAIASAKVPWVDLVIAINPGEKAIVQVDGDVLLPPKQLAGAISVYRDHSYSPAELDQSADQLRKLYVASGYPDAQVSHAISRQKDGTYMIRFVVQAGPKVSIRAIRIEGAHAYPQAKLLGMLQTRPAKPVIDGGTYDPAVWDQDMAGLVGFYQSNGYLAAKVESVDKLLDADGHHLTLVVHLVEGPRSVIHRLLIHGATPTQEAGVLQSIGVNPGDPYNPQRLNDLTAAVQAYFARSGYPIPTVHATFDPDPTPELGTLTFNVLPGPQKRIGDVIYRGNLDTHDDVIDRQLAIKKGQLYNSQEILQTQQNIYQLGFFDQVNVGPLRPISSSPDEPVDLVITMHERETGYVDLGGGFGTLQGPMVSAEYQQTNLFGTGRPIDLKGLISLPRTNLTFSLRDPYLLGNGLIGDVGAGYDREERLGLGGLLNEQTYGPTVGVSRQLTPYLSGSLRYAWSETNYLGTVSEADLAANGNLYNRTNSVFTGGLSYDSRSDLLSPRYGTKTDVSLDVATPLLGGSLMYARPHLSVAHFIPLPRLITLALGADLGYIQPFGETAILPTDTLFILGQNNTLRGFAFNYLNPLLNPSGQALIVTHAEVRFPVWGAFGGVGFIDAGNVWQTPQMIGFGDIKVAVGLGVRYQTPVGPVRVDFGVPIRPSLQFPGWSGFSFGLGQAF